MTLTRIKTLLNLNKCIVLLYRIDFCVSFQSKMKELELLCSLKEVPLDWSDVENAVLALR